VLDPVNGSDVTAVGVGQACYNLISATLAQTNFQYACVVFPGAPFNPLDWAFPGNGVAKTNVTGFCYDFLASGVGPWAMELTHILTYFLDLYGISDSPGSFDNMACACGVHPSTFTKLKLGWLDPSEIVVVQSNAAATATLHALGLPRPSPPGRVTAVKVPTHDPQHYYLIEARLRTDTFEAGIPSEGVVVYEIQEAVWPPVHLRTTTALGVSQSYDNYVNVLVKAAVPGGFTIEIGFPSNAVAVPDLSDMTLAEARAAVIAVGLRLASSGSGNVVAQRPMADTSVPKGSVVHVDLRPPGNL